MTTCKLSTAPSVRIMPSTFYWSQADLQRYRCCVSVAHRYVFNRGNMPMIVFDPDGNCINFWGNPTPNIGQGVIVGEHRLFHLGCTHCVPWPAALQHLSVAVGSQTRMVPTQGATKAPSSFGHTPSRSITRTISGSPMTQATQSRSVTGPARD